MGASTQIRSPVFTKTIVSHSEYVLCHRPEEALPGTAVPYPHLSPQFLQDTSGCRVSVWFLPPVPTLLL